MRTCISKTPMDQTVGVNQENSVRYLKGIGPKKAELLQRVGVFTVRDLCYFFPRHYEDRRELKKISEINPGATVTLRGRIIKVHLKPLKTIKLLEVWIRDESGIVPAIWFNQPYLKNNFHEDSEILVSGKVDLYQNKLQMMSPDYEIIDEGDENSAHVGRIVPVYPLTEGLFQRSLRNVMLGLMTDRVEREVREFLPQELAERLDMLPLIDAIKEMHFPTSFERLDLAKKRLAFDEFFILEVRLFQKLKETKSRYESVPLKSDSNDMAQFKPLLPFQLTHDQEKAILEISADINKSVPMYRLLQGEVGSGKTVVAAFVLQTAAQNSTQAALLAPTEILADQHAANLKKLLSPYATNVKLLTASTSPAEKEKILTDLADGKISLLVGTHAILHESVNFKKLGLVVIDEQHKFGVEQRSKLLNRNPRPHLLVMSATPIPRTLGITLFGDLDISTIRELPANRKPIQTFHVLPENEPKLMDQILKRIEKGEQIYILFPMIEETEKVDAKSARQAYERLRNGVLRNISVGLIHGKLTKSERDEVISRFQKNELKVLVTTSIIEVGVDNPNATVMIVNNADRFGMAQLHQMRGRIGRGDQESTCYLVADPKTDEARARLRILIETCDGFKIAEEDLRLRGPGEFFGFKQSGLPMFSVADMVRDSDLLLLARAEAQRMIDLDPLLNLPENSELKELILQLERTNLN